MTVVLRSLTLLAVIGASCALFVQEMLGTWLSGFVISNTLSLANRQRLLVGLVAGAGAGLAMGAAVSWADEQRLRRLAHRLAPLILLGFLPPLCLKVAWANTLNLCLFMGGAILLAERLFRMSFAAAAESAAVATSEPPGRIGRWWRSIADGLASVSGRLSPRTRRLLPTILVAAGVLGYAIYMSVFTLRMHGRFQTYGYDLGQYDNIFWSTLHGYPMRDAPLHFDKNWQQLQGHAELSIFFFIPIYALRPAASTLLVLQSCVIALGAIPLYRFALRRLPRAYAAVLAFAYLLYPPTHGLQFYDFHFQPMAAPFVLFVIDFVDQRRYWLCALAFVIAIGCREDISVGLAILGAFLALSGHRIRAGLIMAVVATIFFIVMRFFIMPSFGAWGFQDAYKELFPAGAPNFAGIISTIFSNPLYTLSTLIHPDKLRYALQILLPLAFLPLRRTWLAVSFVPGSIFTILTTLYAPTIDIGFQYSAHFPPYLFSASALAIASYKHDVTRQRAALATLIGATLLTGIHWGAIPPRDFIHGGFNTLPMRAPTAAEIQKDRDIKELHALIPPKASVAISEAEMPHVSRQWMRSLRDGTDADFLLYGTNSGYAGATNAERVLATGEFEKIAERPGVVVLKRKDVPLPPGFVGMQPPKPAVPVPPTPTRAPAPPPPPTPATPPNPNPGSRLRRPVPPAQPQPPVPSPGRR